MVGFRKGDGRSLILADRDTRAAVETAFEKVLGYRAPLVISENEAAPAAPAAGAAAGSAPAPGSGETMAGQKQKLRAAAQKSRIALAREHPSVRAAVELLGGEIEDVRDLGEE